MISAATAHAAVASQRGPTKEPILARSEVNRTSGTTANGSCMLRMTWLSTSSLAVPLSPYQTATSTVGMMASRRVESPPEPRWQPKPQKSFHDDLAGEGGGDRGVLPGSQERHGEQRARQRRPQDRREQHVGLLDLRDFGAPVRVEDGCGDDQDGGVDQQREHQSDRRIDGREGDRLPLAGRRRLEVTRLHDGGMQIKIMRHHRRAENADGDVKHLLGCGRSAATAGSR